MRTLALDFGSERIGVAISDEMNLMAHPLEVLSFKAGGEGLLKDIRRLIEEYQAGEVLVGLPVNMNGTLGSSAQKVLDFVDQVKKSLGVTVKIWDERLTTLQGERFLIAADVSRRRRRRIIDSLAAQILLQGYLDSRSS